MRISSVLGALFASSIVMPAIAGSNYSQCVEAANPAQCIARRAVDSSRLDPDNMLEMVLRHGLVDLVPSKPDKLMRGLYDSIGEPDAKMDTPEQQDLDSLTARVLRKSPRKSLLAAMALVAAARADTNPLANPVYLKLAHKAKDDPLIPALALGLWIEVVGYSGTPPRFLLTHAGLPTIWDRAMARKEQDAILLEDIAHTVAYLGVLKPQALEFYLWYIQRPGLTPEQRVGPASALGRFFDMPELAASLLEGVGDDVQSDFDISQRAHIGGCCAPGEGVRRRGRAAGDARDPRRAQQHETSILHLRLLLQKRESRRARARQRP